MPDGKVKQVYVPHEDSDVISDIERLVVADAGAGVKSSFSAKAVQVWKWGLEVARSRNGADHPAPPT